MKRALVLLAHGARDPLWALPLERLREAIAARVAPDTAVSCAFLEFMTPSVSRALDEAAAAGAEEITVVPVFLAAGGHVKRDLPRILEAFAAGHPQLKLTLEETLGERADVIAAMAASVVGADSATR